MSHLLLGFCQWSNSLKLGQEINNSVWLFPFTEILHLLGLAVLGGTLWLLNLRLLGVRLLRDEPLPELARQVKPLAYAGLVVTLASGYALFSSEAVRDFYNWGFRVKMTALLLAIIFTFSVYWKVVSMKEKEVASVWRRAAAIASFLLWLTVGLGGRAIGFISSR